MHKHFRRLYFAIGFLIFSIAVGIGFFSIAEGYNGIDAFYMTVLTISTVGFAEVHPLSNAGKVFTSLYIIFNLSAFGYFISIMSRYLFEGELKEIFYRYLDNRELRKLKDHVIVCGFGRNGYRAVEELRNNNVPFVVIDLNAEIFQKRLTEEEQRNINVVIGDATNEQVLEKAGIATAKAIIACVPRDSINVFISLTAREMNENINIVARATEESTESKLKRAGADHVVMPDTIGGHYMANVVIRPKVVEFLDMINGTGEVKLVMEEYGYNDFKKEYRDITIRDMNLRNVCGVTILGFKSAREGLIFNPNSQTIMGKGDVLIMVGRSKEFERLREVYISGMNKRNRKLSL